MKESRLKPTQNATISYVIGALYLAIALFFFLSLITHSSSDPSLHHLTKSTPQNLFGVFGSYSSDLLLKLFGLASILFVLVPLSWGVRHITGSRVELLWIRFIFFLTSIVTVSALLMFVDAKIASALGISYQGGVVGHLIKSSTSGLDTNYLLITKGALALISLYFALGITFREYARGIYLGARYVFKSFVWLMKKLFNLAMSLKKHSNIPEENYEIPRMEEEIKFDSPPIATPKAVIKAEKPISDFKLTPITKDASSMYEMPPSSLLKIYKSNKNNTVHNKLLESQSQELMKVLQDFGVKGHMIHYFPGPVVTLFEFEPTAGTKSAKIVALSSDIARTMRAASTRISVMTGKKSLGIELPNAEREMVFLRELIESQAYQQTDAKLPLILGKDIGGNTTIVDLASMPHLLIAGTTGSGKSVGINAMILSLLYKHTPETCKFIMIDPKMLELSVYDGIPHLMAPVVTEPSKAVSALKWVVKEMENRYRLMSSLSVRNLDGYNLKIADAIKNNEDLNKKVQVGFDSSTGKPIYENIPIEKKKLPLIVVIVDEMADLMIVAGKEIELSVQRLAQMARAAGIHIIMATQRPSVDVITGVIKANFPTRISFHVTSKIDSRTILGDSGAEQLLGKGDMLYLSGGGKIQRVHGPFLDDNEVNSVVSFWKNQGTPSYDVDITTEKATQDSYASEVQDDLYDDAVRLVKQDKKASTSYIQRYFRIGYNRAASIIERMEKEGIVSAPSHTGKRDVLK